MAATFTTTALCDQWQPPLLCTPIDKKSGDLLWELELPAGVFANPLTYLFEGRQYVAVAFGGGEDVDQIIGLILTGVEP